MKATPDRPKRGRPLKFGRSAHVVAVTLPDEVVRGLQTLHADLGWAIVTLFEQTYRRQRRASARKPSPDAELVSVGPHRSLIVVNKHAFGNLPGVNIIPLHDDRAFLALEPDRGMADLELAVIDRLAAPTLEPSERRALEGLRTNLRKWRRDPTLDCYTRTIIVVDRPRAHK